MKDFVWYYDFGYSAFHNEVWFAYGYRITSIGAHDVAYVWVETLGM